MSRIPAATIGNMGGSGTECMQGRCPPFPRLRILDSKYRNYKGGYAILLSTRWRLLQVMIPHKALTLICVVSIKLTPLGHGEEENHRVIKLNNENQEVAVGRASKNPQKGLLADFDNAWFDYPILSRTHAKFTASPHKRVSISLRRMDQAVLKSRGRRSTCKIVDQHMAHSWTSDDSSLVLHTLSATGNSSLLARE